VAYGHLVDIGREWVEARVPRPLGERVKRALLREGLNSPFFAPALRLGQWLRPLLPAVLRAKVPPRHTQDAQPHRAPVSPTKGAVLMPAGCVQPALRPQIDAATARVLAACGWEVLRPPGGTCCGALRTHLGDAAGGLAQARANIDAWWPYVDPQRPGGPVEAIVSNASGCGVQLKEYGERLAGDPQYAERARLVSARVRDLAEVVAPRQDTLKARLAPGADGPAGQLAVHVPCTLQHGQRLPRVVRDLLTGLGFATEPSVAEGHLCCGSAGTYSVLQPEIATALRDRKLRNLQASHPAQIVSANIGCIQHLQSGTSCPVRHWVELVADVLPA
jgi:glycolate oxidase iron-sulfur subunit